MDRTGVEQSHEDKVVKLVRAIRDAGLEFRGLHYYDGQYGGLDEPQRTAAAHAGYDCLLKLVSDIEGIGVSVQEVVTAGTPTFPCSLTYEGFHNEGFIHRVSPGTIVYNDATSLAQLSSEYGYGPAALILTRVVSHPHSGRVTCDAGHKSVSADAGVPTCVVVGHPELTPLTPSEEHLPLASIEEMRRPQVGELLYLLPPRLSYREQFRLCTGGAGWPDHVSGESVSSRTRGAVVAHARDGRLCGALDSRESLKC